MIYYLRINKNYYVTDTKGKPIFKPSYSQFGKIKDPSSGILFVPNKQYKISEESFKEKRLPSSLLRLIESGELEVIKTEGEHLVDFEEVEKADINFSKVVDFEVSESEEEDNNDIIKEKELKEELENQEIVDTTTSVPRKVTRPESTKGKPKSKNNVVKDK